MCFLQLSPLVSVQQNTNTKLYFSPAIALHLVSVEIQKQKENYIFHSSFNWSRYKKGQIQNSISNLP